MVAPYSAPRTANVGTRPPAVPLPEPGLWWIQQAERTLVEVRGPHTSGLYDIVVSWHFDWTTPRTWWDLARVGGGNGEVEVIGDECDLSWAWDHEDPRRVLVAVGPRVPEYAGKPGLGTVAELVQKLLGMPQGALVFVNQNDGSALWLADMVRLLPPGGEWSDAQRQQGRVVIE